MFTYFHNVYIGAAKALARPRVCIGSPESSLLNFAIRACTCTGCICALYIVCQKACKMTHNVVVFLIVGPFNCQLTSTSKTCTIIEPVHEMSNNVVLRPAKPQISLRIRAV